MSARVAARVALCLLGLVLLPHAFAAPAQQQPVETMRLDDLGKPEAQLDGAWQFHAGDSPLAAGRPWNAYGGRHQQYRSTGRRVGTAGSPRHGHRSSADQGGLAGRADRPFIRAEQQFV
jgi:hypothetical protein